MAGESAFDRSLMATAASQTQTAVDTIRGIQNTMTSNQEALQAGWKRRGVDGVQQRLPPVQRATSPRSCRRWQNLQEKLRASQVNYTATEQANTQAASRITQALS